MTVLTLAPDTLTGPMTPAGEDRILDRTWTAEQLHALAARDRRVQQHVEHGPARAALAAHAAGADTAALRAMVRQTMGTSAGTYWMVAALHLAQLALAHPHLLTPLQYELLLAPLEAAEAVPAAPEHARAA
jgi:hypothetical protein